MSLSTVSATVVDPSGQAFANGTWQLVFKPTPNTSGLFTDGGVPFTTIFGGTLDGTGSFSQAVARNDTIAPALSKWTLIVTPNANSQAFSVDLNVNSGAFNASAAINAVVTNIVVQANPLAHAYKDNEVIPIPGSGGHYYDITNKVLKVWDTSLLAWLTVTPNSGSPTFNSLTITPGLSSLSALTASGNVTQIAGQNQYNAFKINNILYVDGIKYTTIAAAYADLPATGGTVCVPSGYTETLTANLVLNKKVSCIMFMGTATITMGTFQIIVSAGINGVSIVGPIPYGGQGSAQENNAVAFIYTGNSAAFDIGASGTNTFSFYLSKVKINIVAGGAAAIGLRINQVTNYVVEYCGFNTGVSGQIGAQTNGGTLFTGTSTWHSNKWDASGAINVTGIQFGGDGNLSNSDVMSGENHFTLGGAATTSVGIDKKAGDSLLLFCASVDNAGTALTVESTAANAVYGYLRGDSSITNIVNFGPNTSGNYIITQVNKPIIDTGLGTNSVIQPSRYNWRTDVWQNQVGPTFAFFYKDLLDSGLNRLTLVNGAGGDTGLNSGSGGAGLIRLGRDNALAAVTYETAGVEKARVDCSVGDALMRRLKGSKGTAYTAADGAIVLSAGWGTTRTVSGAVGKDQALSFSVNATGTGQAASPTITITFKDGTWTTAPQVMVLRNDLITPFNTPPHTISVTATVLTITFNGTPTAANVYSYIVMCMGI